MHLLAKCRWNNIYYTKEIIITIALPKVNSAKPIRTISTYRLARWSTPVTFHASELVPTPSPSSAATTTSEERSISVVRKALRASATRSRLLTRLTVSRCDQLSLRFVANVSNRRDNQLYSTVNEINDRHDRRRRRYKLQHNITS